MYAVIQSGGKQYRVAPGDVIDVELLSETGEGSVRFDRVLMVSGDGGVEFGKPLVEGALVTASLVGAVRGPKIRVFKMKKRKQYRRTKGHRQDLHRIRIDEITLPSSR
ncbi:MAG TPA: 50S ribosomal protein L21 [Thermoanaerobaculia bacterium]|jgi:large subunit ribosomal protein L21|nr:50S ribosomal protein L21 [Thermoanaerobaculia bacterium]